MALTLYTEWVKTVGADGNAHMDHYPFDKLVCGLVDLARYANHPDAAKTLTRVTAYADKTFQRALAPLADITDNQAYYGRPQEWYTLAENQFRAYQLTGDAMFRRFAEEWLYHAYWNKFAATAAPDGRARRARLQSREHVQQRGDGVRRHRRHALPRHHQERLRLPAAVPVLRDRRVRAERAVREDGRQSRPRARHALRYVRSGLRIVGRASSSRVT